MPINSAKICQYMLGAKDIVAQGARVCQYVSRQQKKEPILRGLYIFEKGHDRHTNNRSQYMPSGIVCQVLMYVNAFNQGVLGHARDYMQHGNTC